MEPGRNERRYDDLHAYRLTELERHDLVVALMHRIAVLSSRTDHDAGELYRLRQLLDRLSGA